MRTQKATLQITAVILLTALLIVAGIAPAAAQESATTGPVTSTVAAGINLNVRSGPGLVYPAFTTLAGGQRVELIGRDNTGAWLQVRLADSRTGWVSRQFLLGDFLLDALPIAGAAPSPGVGGLAQGTVVNAATLNVRTGPGLSFNPFTTLALSQTVTLEGRDASGAWLQVRLPDNRPGWVSSAFISPNLQVASLPEISPTTTPIVATSPVTSSTPTPGSAVGAELQTFDLSLRTGPGLNFPVLTTLPQGQTVELHGRNADSSWLLVRAPDGSLGWVNSAVITTTLNLATLPEATPATAPLAVATTPAAGQETPGTGGLATATVVNASLLNVRTGPGLNYTILATLPLGASVVLEGRDAPAAWLQVRLADGRLGWVSSAFIAANLDIANLPVTG